MSFSEDITFWEIGVEPRIETNKMYFDLMAKCNEMSSYTRRKLPFY